ncbi:MAG: DUF2442 domain-containing protein [Lentisphaerae bacterium]|nr:DUF2442 domain-containing protein [Lentisphaerota bacterium]
MIPKVVDASYRHDYVIRVRFADGAEGNVDLRAELHGEVFEPLLDIRVFQDFAIHPDFHTLCWPNGADLAPEFLYEKIHVPA